MASVGPLTNSKKGGGGKIDFEDASGPLHNSGRLTCDGHGLGHLGYVGLNLGDLLCEHGAELAGCSVANGSQQ